MKDRYYTAFSKEECQCHQCRHLLAGPETTPIDSTQVPLRSSEHRTSRLPFVMSEYKPGLQALRAQAGTILHQSTGGDGVKRMEKALREIDDDARKYTAASTELANAVKVTYLAGLSPVEKRDALKKSRKAAPFLDKSQSITRATFEKERFLKATKELPDWEFLSAHSHINTLGYMALIDLLALAQSNSLVNGLALLTRALWERMLNSNGKIIRFQHLTAIDFKTARNKAYRWEEPPSDDVRGCVWIKRDQYGIPSIAISRLPDINWPGAPWDKPTRAM